MIPKIQCPLHQEEIVLIDIYKQPSRTSRLYCLDCLDQVELKKTCQLKRFIQLATDFGKKRTEQIQEEYIPYIFKLEHIIKTWNTLKDQIIQSFNSLIQSAEYTLQELIINMEKEQDYYKFWLSGITRTKLEDVAQQFSSDIGVSQIRNKIMILGQQLYSHQEKIISYQSESVTEYNNIFWKMTLKNEIRCQQQCWALASNSQIIVGGVGEEIIIWKQIEQDLFETAVLKGHDGNVLAIAINKLGNMIVSGGDCCDQTIKLWQLLQNNWKCTQTIHDHTNRITDLKLANDQLISVSSDQSLKVWTMINKQFYCIQTIQEHFNDIYYVTLNPNLTLMASSSKEDYINVYKYYENDSEPWQTVQRIFSKGEIVRVYFIDDCTLISQQENPPKLNIYLNFQLIQEINLQEAISSIMLFPIIQIGKELYLNNGECVFVIMAAEGKYYVEKAVEGLFWSGCADVKNQCLIMGNKEKKTIQIYSYQ